MNKIINKIVTNNMLLACFLMSLSFALMGQTTDDSSFLDYFGKGYEIGSKDSDFYTKFSARLQSRFDGVFDEGDDSYSTKYRFRRARLKFDGFTFTPKLVHKIEYDVVNSQMLDAVIKWNFAGNFNFWIGQTKLPGNRERVISSQKLQFVDRSLLNSKFTLDRDKGIQLRHHFNWGDALIREIWSMSKGEGRKFKGENFGYDYTGRIEILPFGAFTKKGDYFSSDLKRETSPKLAVGITYDYNDNAIDSRGQLGSSLSETRDLEALFVDMMYKYNGISVLAEYANKKTNNGTAGIYNTDGDLIESFYTGSAFNGQVGYLFKNNWEIAGRFTTVNPEASTLNNDLRQYTIGVSRYIAGHNFKVQGDLSLLEESNKSDQVILRLQMELAF